MAIDNSILTHCIYAICTIICCIISHKKSKNRVRTFFIFLFGTTTYFVVSCSILPIQFTNTGVQMHSFYNQFSMMSASQFKKYFLDYLVYNISYAVAYLTFAFVGCILFCRLRKFVNSMLLLLFMLLVHLIYNVGLNVMLNEVVKAINAEDFLIMTMGFLLGWSCARITLILYPALAEKVLVRESGV